MSELLLPDRPEEPLPSDCCNSGCTPCILDVYDDLVKEWEDKCNRLKLGAAGFDVNRSFNEPALFQTKYSPFRIAFIKPLSNDTSIFRFQAVKKDSDSDEMSYRDLETNLDLKPSQYLILQGKDTVEGKENHFTRAYTPISTSKGCFDVVIKMYPKGKMSQFIQKLVLGNITFWRGPYGGFSYEPNKFRRLLMLCAGTGIAPLYSLASNIVNNEEDETTIKILFCCKDEANIILREEIHSLRSFWNFSADIYLPHSCASTCKPLYGETLKTGRLGQDAIASELKCNSTNTWVLICGNPEFCKEMHQFVSKCSIKAEHIHIFD
ncbi:NADH-cytochrome b5 reductase-like [Thrips palmi]|uniref:NADH-cytochrome b5 reductase n=1 Tax=Thrips palmi TaxID=161013 RepID=A0A6P8YLW2_THRPL|nr:NADH-cytochrome b5 reductase-like [Thrips palmi]